MVRRSQRHRAQVASVDRSKPAINRHINTGHFRLTVERGWGRLERGVLDWNEPSMAFYKKLGAEPLDDWTVFRVTGDALKNLAATKN